MRSQVEHLAVGRTDAVLLERMRVDVTVQDVGFTSCAVQVQEGSRLVIGVMQQHGWLLDSLSERPGEVLSLAGLHCLPECGFPTIRPVNTESRRGGL